MQIKVEVFDRTGETSSRLGHLSLADVATMAHRREVDGWYVARMKDKGIMGHSSRGEYDSIIVLNGTVMTFDSMSIAIRYVRALLSPTIAERSDRLNHERAGSLRCHRRGRNDALH